MAYTPTYDANEIGEIIIDLFANVGVELVAFGVLIALVILWRFMTQKRIL